jgi:RNA polymerase subunit RPABC4/transcription elongation factor Spt4
MKLTQQPCPNCHHLTAKDKLTCPTCGVTKKLTADQVWSLGVANIARTYPTGTVQKRF